MADPRGLYKEWGPEEKRRLKSRGRRKRKRSRPGYKVKERKDDPMDLANYHIIVKVDEESTEELIRRDRVDQIFMYPANKANIDPEWAKDMLFCVILMDEYDGEERRKQFFYTNKATASQKKFQDPFAKIYSYNPKYIDGEVDES